MSASLNRHLSVCVSMSVCVYVCVSFGNGVADQADPSPTACPGLVWRGVLRGSVCACSCDAAVGVWEDCYHCLCSTFSPVNTLVTSPLPHLPPPSPSPIPSPPLPSPPFPPTLFPSPYSPSLSPSLLKTPPPTVPKIAVQEDELRPATDGPSSAGTGSGDSSRASSRSSSKAGTPERQTLPPSPGRGSPKHVKGTRAKFIRQNPRFINTPICQVLPCEGGKSVAECLEWKEEKGGRRQRRQRQTSPK